MIPTIPEILSMLLQGGCSSEEAERWIDQHMDIAAKVHLRDFFAGCTLGDVAARNLSVLDVSAAYARIAHHCYRMADAMLAARSTEKS